MNASNAGVPLEIVAAITAAIAAVLERPVGSFVVTAIRPEAQGAPVHSAQAAPVGAAAWSKAGVLESHLLRRQFGIRSR